MKYSSYTQFNTDIKKNGMDYACAKAKAVGFEGVEFYEGRTSLEDTYSACQVKDFLQKYGLCVTCYSVFADLINGDTDRIYKTVDYASKLGSPYFHHTLFPEFDVRFLYGDLFDKTVNKAVDIAKYCNEKGMTVIYEPQGYYFNGVSGLGRIFEAVKEKCDIGFCADFGNSLFVDEKTEDVFSAFVNDIKHIHIKDFYYSENPRDYSPEYRSRNGKYIYNAQLFEGDVNIDKCFDTFKKIGYDGFVSFEFTADEQMTETLMTKLNGL